MFSRMPNSPETMTATGIRHRKPRAGERTRGAVDAMQTKFAVGVQNLDPHDYLGQLQANIDELPDASGADAAFIALISEDGSEIESVLSSSTGFAQCTPGLLASEKLEDWQWLRGRLGHLRVVEVADTLNGPKVAQDDLERLSELHIGSTLIIGFSVHDEIAGFLGITRRRMGCEPAFAHETFWLVISRGPRACSR
jgi:hypothetical protein